MVIKTFQNPKGHHNSFVGSKGTVILLIWWIFPIGGFHREGSAINGATPSSLLSNREIVSRRKQELKYIVCLERTATLNKYKLYQTSIYLYFRNVHIKEQFLW